MSLTFEQAMRISGLMPPSYVPADGKWKRWYVELISKRLNTPPNGYSERHHIVPKGLGGSDDPANIVHLTGREHYVAHALLARIYGGTMWLAVVRMKGRQFGGGYWNSRLFDKARQEWAKWSSENQCGENNPAFGKVGHWSGKKRPNFSGENHPQFGKPMYQKSVDALKESNTGAKRTEETKRKIGDAQRGEKNHAYGKTLSAEHRAKVSVSMQGRFMSDDHKRRIGEALKGRVYSEETIQKMRDAARRREAAKKTVVQL